MLVDSIVYMKYTDSEQISQACHTQLFGFYNLPIYGQRGHLGIQVLNKLKWNCSNPVLYKVYLFQIVPLECKKQPL